MATTESRSGFRLPWVGEHRTDDPDDPANAVATAETEAMPGATGDASTDSGVDETASNASPDSPVGASESGPATSDHRTGSAPTPATGPATAARQPKASAATVPAAAPAATSRKPTKFLADLTRAMQAAAEAERQETLELFALEAKSYVESIHARSATEAEDLRKRADEDIAAIREWSKAEIARIREETDQKVSGRKEELGREVDDHAARIEREIERVHSTVGRYEQEMASFFESLLGETDPTRFAALAANLPEPPSFESVTEAASVEEAPELEAPAAVEPPAIEEPAVEPSAVEPSPVDAGDTEVAETEPSADEPEAAADEALMSTADREAAFAAIEAAARAAEAEDAADDSPTDEAAGSDDAAGSDPRLAALGLTGFAEAEAEALADLPSADDEIPEIGDDALAARLAGLVPDGGTDQPHPAAGAADAHVQTSVVVVGLVSVASIASFKRHLARIPGVASVGVSSGPDGEFVFAVSHDPSLELRDVIPGLPGFAARVTETGDGFVRVTAHDADAS
jgi:hypothetical protein